MFKEGFKDLSIDHTIWRWSRTVDGFYLVELDAANSIIIVYLLLILLLAFGFMVPI